MKRFEVRHKLAAAKWILVLVVALIAAAVTASVVRDSWPELAAVFSRGGSRGNLAAIEGAGSGLVGWYKLDETSGSTASDASGNNNNGTVSVSNAWSSGFVGTGALAMGNNIYVSVPTALNTAPVSYSVWFNMPPLDANAHVSQGILLSDSDTSPVDSASPTAANPFLYITVDGHLTGGWHTSGSLITSTTNVDDNQWHNAVIENDGTTQTLYLDGNLVGSGPAGPFAHGFLQIGVGNTTIPNNSAWPGTYWGWRYLSGGSVDDVRIYNRLLTSSEAQTIYSSQYSSNTAAATCAESDVRVALSRTSSGGTVTIPSGNCTWTSSLVVTQPVTLQGAGIGSTVIVDGLDLSNDKTNHALIDLEDKSGGLTRVTGMTIDQGSMPKDPTNKGALNINVAGSQWRVDNMRFAVTRRAAIYVMSTGGVIDHNVFDVYGYYNVIYGFNGINAPTGGDPYGDVAWTRGINLGSRDSFYFVEDNTFTQHEPYSSTYTALNAASDGWSGQRIVFRHNTLNNMWFANHGTESSGLLRGARSFEIYDNNFNYTGGPWGSGTTIALRSGNGVIWGNTFSGGSAVPDTHALTSNYRDFADFAPWGACDGTSPYDVNDGQTYLTGTMTSDGYLSPAYYVMTDSTAHWTKDQWVGYSLTDTTSGGPGSIIVSNSTTTLLVIYDTFHRLYHNGSGTPLSFHTGDGYKILRASTCLDQTGRGAGDLMTRDSNTGDPTSIAWPHQVPEQTYTWGNAANGVQYDLKSNMPHVVENRDFYNQTCPTGYAPFTYPHPLTGLPVQQQPLNCPGTTPPSTYTLSVAQSGSGSGYISGGTISCGSACSQGSITAGTSITLNAVANSGSTFAGWGGACSSSGTASSCSVTVNANTSVSATFNTAAQTQDTTPPVISAVTSGTPSDSGAVISWTTDESSDSRVEYGLTTAYGNVTDLASTLVFSHAVTLSGLSSNTAYHYRVRSADASGNLATSSDYTFATAQTVVNTPPNNGGSSNGGGGSSSSGGGGSSSSGGGGSSNGGGGSTNVVTTPAVVIPPYTNPAAPVIVPAPTSYVPNLTSAQIILLQQILVVEGFLPRQYVTGRYDSVTQSAVAALQTRYGIVSKGTPMTTGLGAVGPKTKALLNKLYATDKSKLSSVPVVSMPAATATPAASTALPATTASGAFSTTLSLGSSNSDVRRLQVFLNAHGYAIAASGNGAPGHESTYFGTLTQNALKRFQSAYAASASTSNGGLSATGILDAKTRAAINAIILRK